MSIAEKCAASSSRFVPRICDFDHESHQFFLDPLASTMNFRIILESYAALRGMFGMKYQQEYILMYNILFTSPHWCSGECSTPSSIYPGDRIPRFSCFYSRLCTHRFYNAYESLLQDTKVQIHVFTFVN